MARIWSRAAPADSPADTLASVRGVDPIHNQRKIDGSFHADGVRLRLQPHEARADALKAHPRGATRNRVRIDDNG